MFVYRGSLQQSVKVLYTEKIDLTEIIDDPYKGFLLTRGKAPQKAIKRVGFGLKVFRNYITYYKR